MSTIRAIRELLGVTQSELGHVIGCTQSNVAHIENLGQTVMPDAARKIKEFAASKGVALTLGQIYGDEPLSSVQNE